MVVELVPHMLEIIPLSPSDVPVPAVIKNVFEVVKWELLDVNAKTNFNENPFLNLPAASVRLIAGSVGSTLN